MYTKLFSSITDSTIWGEEDHTRLVWITMLAMADRYGHVAASVPGLAARARVSLDKTISALARLSAPDEWSRSKEFDGRRIDEEAGGWVIINYTKYAKIRDEEERKEYMRNYMRKRRKQDVSKVSSVNSSKPGLAHTDADIRSKAVEGSEVDTTQNKIRKGGGSVKNPPPSQSDFDQRDWRKIAEAKRIIADKVKAGVGRQCLTDEEYWKWVSELSGVTLKRVMQLQKSAMEA